VTENLAGRLSGAFFSIQDSFRVFIYSSLNLSGIEDIDGFPYLNGILGEIILPSFKA
jgi:hypothetical protein